MYLHWRPADKTLPDSGLQLVLALVKKNRKTVEAAEHERLALFSLNNEACAHSVRLLGKRHRRREILPRALQQRVVAPPMTGWRLVRR